MYTFNLGLVFGRGEAVIMIVCASEEPIDQAAVNVAASRAFQEAVSFCDSTDKVIGHIMRRIEEECDCQTVKVEADAACFIARLEKAE